MKKWQQATFKKGEYNFSGGIVSRVEKGSIGSGLGILPGDEIIKINNKGLRDIIDFKILSDAEEFAVDFKRKGKLKTIKVVNRLRQPLGIYFQSSIFDSIKTCRNKCIFCFVDQLPKSLRKSLYLKDDDYRLSFLYGNFITLNNIEEIDIERIISQRLTPLYLSFHSAGEEVRKYMMGSSNPKIYSYLKDFSESGIDMHIQIVLCPGINNGEELESTLCELQGKYPCVRSVGIVPVGLTSHRRGLFPLRSFTLKEIRALIEQIEDWQERCRREMGISWVYLADEFYLIADSPLPASFYYDDFPQIENGIGLARRFIENVTEQAKNFDTSRIKERLFIVAGKLINKTIKSCLKETGFGEKVKVFPVTNVFFGSQVTVSGLLAGGDILFLKNKIKGTLLLSEAMLNDDSIFLDNTSLEELQQEFKVPIKLVAQDGTNLLRVLTEDT